MATDIRAYTRIAKVTSINDIGKEGVIQAKLVGSPKEELPLNVMYTSPYYVPVNGKEAARFTGLTAFPGVGAYILICSNPDDFKWYYISSIAGKAGYYDDLKRTNTGGRDLSEEEAILTAGPEGEYKSFFPGADNQDTTDK